MSFAEIGEQIDLPTLDGMNAYYRKFPPVHIMMAARYGAGEMAEKTEEPQPDLMQVMQQFPQPH